MKLTAPEKTTLPEACVYEHNDLRIEINCRGNSKYTKVSYPVKYGLFSRLESKNFIFEFNLNHEITHARSKQNGWIHPSEWLKRTMGNDWVYYSTGGYSGVYEAIGEYYLPNLMYATNSLLGGKPFETEPIQDIVNNWPQMLSSALEPLSDQSLPDTVAEWRNKVLEKNPHDLEEKAKTLFDIGGSRVTVMPPDARHTDYNFIPLDISDGCLYKCRFCKIKNKKPFKVRSKEDIASQISQLKILYGKNIINTNAIFLGEHDALNTPDQIVIDTTRTAMAAFEFDRSYMKDKYLFTFASADALLNTSTSFFEQINTMEIKTFINVGLESCDNTTLKLLGKPLTAEKVSTAFNRIQDINREYGNVEISCNFVMDDSLPTSHHESVLSLLRESVARTQPKGAVYLSPLQFAKPSRQVLYDFYKIKTLSRFPTFLYIIQRL